MSNPHRSPTGSGNDAHATEPLPTGPADGTAAGSVPGGAVVPAEASGAVTEPAPTGDTTSTSEKSGTLRYTRTAGTWAAVVVAIVILVVLLIFILQNQQSVTVTFLGLRAGLPLGVAMLMSAAIGGLLVALIGSARILQLRRTARRRKR